MNVTDIVTSAALIDRLRQGMDADAWTEFALRYREPLLDFAEARGWTQVDAEGAVQETLRIVATTLHTYHPERGRFRDWLLGILRNRLKMALRKENDRLRRERAYACDWETLHVPESDAALWRRVLVRHALRQLLAEPSLAGRTRAVFIDYVLRRRPALDVAAAYGLTPNAVYQIRSRLLARLRQRLRAMMVANEP